MVMELELLRYRLLSGITEQCFNQENFSLAVPPYRLRHYLEYRCNKDILIGKNCFKCAYNPHPNRKTGTICGILNYMFPGKIVGDIFINHPQKSVCAFCKTR